MTQEALRAALKRAYNLGQIYWQQADSEYISQQDKSDITAETFRKLVEDTVASFEEQP